ncbi:MAG: dihydroorotate dehydrogenase electron transfer subunit [Chromatiales bacterium]|jgi:dihydroorotate dehydrogenase electron transfer subunit|nr:dihydroorotate dehydrogenase electron transfer subunit [Chromatiales bacterium]
MSSTAARPHRGTIHSVTGEVLDQASWPGEQYVLRLRAPEVAARARAGQFVHVQCATHIPMRRPLSLLGASAGEGWIDVLYKVHGTGLAALALARPGDQIAVLGPIGQGFRPDAARPQAVLIGGGVGIPPLVFLARQLRAAGGATVPVGFFGSELPFPFALSDPALPLPGVPGDATASLAVVDGLGVPARLASRAGLAGCHDGFVTDLARHWLASLPPSRRDAVTIYACGPEPMLRATQRLATAFGLPTQLCLEEYMACAVGGCAGCVVPVVIGGKRAMKRVCVDGPVFDGSSVYPDAA